MPNKFFKIFAIFAFAIGCNSVPLPDEIANPKYQPVIDALQDFISYQMQDKDLPAVSIALVDDQEVVWARGFGFADPENKVAATANTIYRVGSVSKLFTDIGIMQLVERGEIDLDAPVTQYLPDFSPHNPFGKPITLRQLMSHRAGLVREPPVGHYFDPTEPSLAQTVASLNTTTLVYEPETRIKYSNAGIAVVGYVLEHLAQKPFPDYLQKTVLDPMGLSMSAFAPNAQTNAYLAKAKMWSYDGREFDAPTFELGMTPAGSMYSTVLDLAQFTKVLFNGGKGPDGQVLKPETLEQMWTPQFAEPGAKSGFGIGFSLSELQGYRRVGHGGAIYGFATQLFALPEAKLGVVIVTSMDIANAVMTEIADLALKSLLALRDGKPLPEMPKTAPVDPAMAKKLDGRYENQSERIELVERDGKLYLWRGSERYTIKTLGETLVTDDRLGYGQEIVSANGDSILVNGRSFWRVLFPKPAPVNARWRDLIGEYGWDHNVLFILEKDAQMHALIEWGFLYPLAEVGADTFAFPDYGLYHGENLIFKRNGAGKVQEVLAAGIAFKRRKVGAEDGETFKIDPVKPMDELRKEALAAQPPEQPDDLLAPDLVDLAELDNTIKFDIRYATTNNFMNAVFYKLPKAFMQRPAAEALVRANRSLKKRGYGLLIHDAYRPWYVTKMFWDATPENMKDFVANPATGSIHNRGAAVDLTLYDLKTGNPVQMVGGYDEFSERSFPDYVGGTSLQRWHRELLRDAMEARGFRVYQYEWWHFNHENASKYPVLNLTFEEILEKH